MSYTILPNRNVAIAESDHVEILSGYDAEEFLADLATLKSLPPYQLRELGIAPSMEAWEADNMVGGSYA